MNDEIEWFEGQRGRPSGKLVVAISADGRLYLGADLMHLSGFLDGYIKLGYQRATGTLHLKRVEHAADGVAKLYRPQNRGATVACRNALAHWDLVPKERRRYAARIADGEIVIDMSQDVHHEEHEGHEGERLPVMDQSHIRLREVRAPRAEPERITRTARAKAAALDEAIDAEDEDIGLPLKKPAGKCQECRHWRNELCTLPDGPKAYLYVGAGDGCERHVHRPAGPPPAAVPEEPPQRPNRRPATRGPATHYKRKRVLCCACGHILWVTGKGIVPHDLKGVAYIAGHGDRKRRCPGSNT